mgnify:CR=1 FL=1
MKLFVLFLSVLVCWNVLSADYVPGEYIVKTANKSALKNYKSLSNDLYKVKLTEKEAALLKSKVEYIEPNYIYHAMAVPSKQWGLTSINVEKAWKKTKGSPKIIVGVIDTGVDYTHDALKSHIWKNTKEIAGNGIDDDNNGFIDDINGWDFANKDNDPMDDNNHGTHCSGIVAADSTTLQGVAPRVTIMPLKFLTGEGSGTLEAAIEAINYGVRMGANVLSNSWGGGGYSEALRDAIVAAKEKGVLFVAAAGNEYNDNDEQPSYPASYEEDNVIRVAASTSTGTKASFSNYGVKSVHIFAPGKDILSSIPGNKAASYSGTSMATPFVSGLAALLLSQDPKMDYGQVKDIILNTANKLPGLKGLVQTDGQIDAGAALK